MKVICRGLVAAALVVALAACHGESHFLTDRDYRDRVHDDFLARRELAAGRAEALFSVFDRPWLTTEQREALEFLYAYMPLCDLAEYTGEYFLGIVDGALRARDTFSWGRSVPEDVFRHFVLVHRVNNEYMDEARDVFFEELRDRVKDLPMAEAALEVNHWCHEKVTYRGSDARTSAPLATMKTSWGRCGEESVFTVAALRAVGIPARQSYTPRWVHTDDNHAWVEVWVDGRWHYMGACEPEPRLDAAWFDGPVKRAMMTHTTVYGLYDGPEEKSVETPLYSVINTLANYAPTRRAAVRVVDGEGNPVEGARVQFKVYNYAELYPLVTARSDAEGRAFIDTGRGDLMIWADRDGRYGYVKSGPEDEEVTLVMDRMSGEKYGEQYVLAPPAEQPAVQAAGDQAAANAARLAREDSIRNAYMATFPGEDYARGVARETGLAPDKVWQWLSAAQGNWRDVEAFVRAHAANPLLDGFMAELAPKDLRDTPTGFLNDHFVGPPVGEVGDVDHSLLISGVLSPRIGTELIMPWRWHFYEQGIAGKDPREIEAYVKERVRVSDADNYYNCRLTPVGVHELRVADAASRDIYFVALCRTAGVPARLEPATAKPQYHDGRGWVSAAFDAVDTPTAPRATLTLHGDPDNAVAPGYGTHFTVAKFQDGDFRTLDLGSYFSDGARRDADMGGYGGRAFPVGVELDEGYYRIMVASRANDGSVTVHADYLSVEGGGSYDYTVTLPHVDGKLFVKGVLDMNSVVETDGGGKTTLKQLGGGKGVLICFADPAREPTRHILQKMPRYRAALEEWGGGVLMVVPEDRRTDAFDPSQYTGMPSQAVWAGDTGRRLLGAAAAAIQTEFGNNFPLVVYITSNGGAVFSSEGYRIGIIDDVLRTIKLEQQTAAL